MISILAPIFITALIFGPSYARAACLNPDLGKKAKEAATKNERILRLDVTQREKLLSGLDRVVSVDDLQIAFNCLEHQLDAQSGLLPEELRSYRRWKTDRRIHHFPGNEFSYGRIFVSENASGYLRRRIVQNSGSVIVKEAFRFEQTGEARLHEIALMIRDKNTASGWRWLKADADGRVSEDSTPCLVCHAWHQKRGYQFGYRFITSRKVDRPTAK